MGKISSILALSLFPFFGLAAQESKGLDISLISETPSVAPGKTITVGLRIHHHSGFHTYWKNPGIVGMATAIKWKLPDGFTASEIRWPYPELTSMAGHPCHGYERGVILIVEITAPKKIPTKMVTFTAKTRWMCCAKDCYPGFKDFTLELPVSDKTILDPKTSQHFKRARNEMPSKAAPWETTMTSKADAKHIKLRLTPNKANAPAPDYLFSEDGQISSNKKQKFTKKNDGSFCLEVLRSEFSPKNKTSLPAVIKAGNSHFRISPTYLQL
ncbi:MAG: hypothetical protein HN759_00490 [Akkermansiaceae bacterium]|nr:hypothetical protein [Akkermansiaceae bacterium]